MVDHTARPAAPDAGHIGSPYQILGVNSQAAPSLRAPHLLRGIAVEEVAMLRRVVRSVGMIEVVGIATIVASLIVVGYLMWFVEMI